MDLASVANKQKISSSYRNTYIFLPSSSTIFAIWFPSPVRSLSCHFAQAMPVSVPPANATLPAEFQSAKVFIGSALTVQDSFVDFGQATISGVAASSTPDSAVPYGLLSAIQTDLQTQVSANTSVLATINASPAILKSFNDVKSLTDQIQATETTDLASLSVTLMGAVNLETTRATAQEQSIAASVTALSQKEASDISSVQASITALAAKESQDYAAATAAITAEQTRAQSFESSCVTKTTTSKQTMRSDLQCVNLTCSALTANGAMRTTLDLSSWLPPQTCA